MLEPFPSLMPFSAPTGLALDVASFAPVLLLVAFALWVVFTIVSGYHWFRYAHRSWLAAPAVGTHIFISAALFLYALSGLA